MAIRVGINGFGRIGRNFFRAQHALGADLDIVALNDLGDAKTMAHLLRYDSTLGPFEGEVELADGALKAAGRRYGSSPSAIRAHCPGGTSASTSCSSRRASSPNREGAQKHLDAGAKKVVISAPATDPDVTIVLGVNDERTTRTRITSSRTRRAPRTAWRRLRRCCTTSARSSRAS